MEILSSVFMDAFICIALVFQVVLWNFMELRNKKTKEENGDGSNHNSNSSSPGETQPPQDDASNDANATPPRAKRKKKDDEGSSSKSIPFCRFCKQIFTSPQALGGHMNRHRGEREKEEFQKAEILIHTKGQNYALAYPGGGAPSYYQPEGNCGSHYQGGGTQLANASMMMGNMGVGLPRQVYQNSNQQFVGSPQMNPNYAGTHQQTASANYQSQPQHGGSYVNYNQCDNALRPSQIQGGVPQTSYTPRANSGQYQTQGAGSLLDVRPYAMPHGGSTTGVGQHHQSNSTGFTGQNLSQAAPGGGNIMPSIVDNTATLGTASGIGSNPNAGLRQSTAANQAIAQFVDQCGNIVIQGPSSGYSTGLRPLNPSHFHDSIQATEYVGQGPRSQDPYTSQASFAGTSVHDTIQVQSDQYATAGMENQYHASGVPGMLNFHVADEGDEFENGGSDLSTIAVTESGHGGGVSTGRSADARSHL